MTESLSVVTQRTVEGSPKQVFRAFTEVDFLKRWFSPDPEIRIDVLTIDLRAGGTFRFAYHQPDGEVDVVIGAYQVVDPGKRLVFTWTWEAPDPHAGIETLVSIHLRTAESGTEITVRHTKFPEEEVRSRHDIGWNTTLDRLPALLSTLVEEEA